MSHDRPLSEGNRLQRAYFRWAAPHYARIEPGLREQVELIDRFLYSRRGLLFWGGMACATVGTALAFSWSGFPAVLAVLLSLLLWGALPLSLLSAWLQPALFTRGSLNRRMPGVLAAGFVAALLGFTVGHVARRGQLDGAALWSSLSRSAAVLAPAVLLAALAISALIWGVARVRQHVLERELREARLQLERDEALRGAAQAQLDLLRLQIQPHFIFNTLSAVQHWVDSADPRAGPLLHALTAFLRGATEALGRDRARLADEATLAGHYLHVMQSRLGQRLRYAIELSPEAADWMLPPGLLLTLVENAVEHGVGPLIGGGDVQVRAGTFDGLGRCVEVSDSGGTLALDAHDGVGLSNCRARLRHAFGDAGRLELAVTASRTLARIHLP